MIITSDNGIDMVVIYQYMYGFSEPYWPERPNHTLGPLKKIGIKTFDLVEND